MNKLTNQNEANKITVLSEFIKENMYSDKLDDDEPFFFNVNTNEADEVDLGSGSDIEHLHLCMTSRFLMKSCADKGVKHSDGTYKITSHGYPLIVFGVTDIQGENLNIYNLIFLFLLFNNKKGSFHPISFMITSHESEIDFKIFFRAIKELAFDLNIEFDSEFFIQDAQRACYNATKHIFPDATVLMCYFHVRLNIKKHKHLMKNQTNYDELNKDINEMHKTLNMESYKISKKSFAKKWSTIEPAMYNYIREQWLIDVFSKWQVFRNLPGYANTNSNIESWNATYKRDYSRRVRQSVLRACTTIFKTIKFNSQIKNNKFQVRPAFDKEIKKAALIVKKIQFKQLNRHTVEYTGLINGTKAILSLSDPDCYKSCNCSCFQFQKWAICIHVVAFSNINKHDWYGAKFRQPDKFEIKSKRGAKVKRLGNSGRIKLATSALNYD